MESLRSGRREKCLGKQSHVCHHRVSGRMIFVDFLTEDKTKCLSVSNVYPPPKGLAVDAQEQVCYGAAV